MSWAEGWLTTLTRDRPKNPNNVQMLKAYFALLLLFLLLLGQPGGRRALPAAAAVVSEAASTVPDPSASQHKQQVT